MLVNNIKIMQFNIGIVCNAYLRVNLCKTLLLPKHKPSIATSALHMIKTPHGGNIGIVLLEPTGTFHGTTYARIIAK